MRKWIIVAVSIAVMGTAASIYAATELARINNSVISLEDFNRRYEDNQKFFRYKVPTKRGVLDEMIKRELGVQEAKRLGLDKNPEVIERINTVLYHSLVDMKLAKQFDAINISNAEIDAYYKKNPEIRTSHIFVQLRTDATPAQEKAALEKIKHLQTQLTETLKGGKQTFAEFAHANSEGVAAATGGDIDYQTKDKLDPTYYESAVKLGKIGAISGIVRSQFGYHIIKLTGIKDIKDIDRGQYKRMIYDDKRTQIFDAYMDSLRKGSKVSVNYNLIKEEPTKVQ